MAGAILILSHLLGPRSKVARDELLAPYESGIKSPGYRQQRYPVKFYLIAVLFVIFDVETVFLYPWAVSVGEFKAAGQAAFWFVEMVVFIAILLVGYIYMVAKGAFKWE